MNKPLQLIKSVFGGDSLKARFAGGAAWLSTGSVIENAFRIVRNLILVRLIAPEAFGVLALVLGLNAAVISLTEIGIREAIVQHPEGETEEYLNTAWFLSLGRGIAIYALIYIIAPYYASFFGNPDLSLYVRFSSLNILFDSAMSIRVYVLIKQMSYKRWIIINNGGSLFGVTVIIILACYIQNIWVLLLGALLESFAHFVLSYLICPFVPHFRFAGKAGRDLVKFVRGAMGIPMMHFIFTRIDTFFIGKMLPAASLGLYDMCSSLAKTPSTLATGFIGLTTLPIFSRKQADKATLNTMIVQLNTALGFVAFPLIVFMACYGHEVLTFVYGVQYAAVSVPFAIIFGTGILSMIFAPVVSLFYAVGRPESVRFFGIVRVIVMSVLVYPAVKYYGLTGATLASLIAILVSMGFQVAMMRKLIGTDLVRYIAVYLYAMGASAMVLVVWLLTRDYVKASLLYKFASGFLGCALAYISAFLLLARKDENFGGLLRASGLFNPKR